MKKRNQLKKQLFPLFHLPPNPFIVIGIVIWICYFVILYSGDSVKVLVLSFFSFMSQVFDFLLFSIRRITEESLKAFSIFNIFVEEMNKKNLNSICTTGMVTLFTFMTTVIVFVIPQSIGTINNIITRYGPNCMLMTKYFKEEKCYKFYTGYFYITNMAITFLMLFISQLECNWINLLGILYSTSMLIISLFFLNKLHKVTLLYSQGTAYVLEKITKEISRKRKTDPNQ